MFHLQLSCSRLRRNIRGGSHCWFTTWRYSAHLCCLFNFQEEGVKIIWLSSQQLHFLWSSNLETGFGSPGLQLLHLLLKMCNLQSQTEERAATENTAGTGTNVSALGSCLNYTINTGHFAAKAGNSSWTLTGKNIPSSQHSDWNDWTGHRNNCKPGWSSQEKFPFWFLNYLQTPSEHSWTEVFVWHNKENCLKISPPPWFLLWQGLIPSIGGSVSLKLCWGVLICPG